MGRRIKGLTVLLLPDEGGKPRSIRVSARGAQLGLSVGLLVLVGGLVMATSWWYLALEAGRNRNLQFFVDSLQEERVRFLILADELDRIAAEYDHLRSLFGTTSDPVSSGLWLPPAGLPAVNQAVDRSATDDHLPTSWPLTEAGFVTQPLVEGESGDHPGVDIAIGTGSYVRAAGAGRVLRIGEDPLYGLFVVLDHGEGYQTVYAHASLLLVERGETVRRNEVIALTGSTGRSTAPHLHFEILLDGVPLDPLSMVDQPN